MEWVKKIGKSLIIGTLVGAAIAVITNNFVPDLINRLENQSYYMRYYWKSWDLRKLQKSDEEKESQICIIDIDDRSQHKLGMYWNWNRSYHADMINSLKKHFPAAIVFDINFYDPEDQHHIDRIKKLLSRNQEIHADNAISDRQFHSILSTIDYDKRFVDATRSAGMVFHGLRMSDEADYPPHALSQVENRKTMGWHESLHPSSAIELPPDIRSKVPINKSYIDGIFTELAQAARDIGHLNITHNKDGVIREIPLLYGFGKNKMVYLPISIRTIATLFGTKNEEIRFEPGRYIDIGKPFKIFKDKDNRLLFSYPNVTSEQVKAILGRAEEILSLPSDKSISLTTFLKIGRSEDGGRYVEMYCGVFPEPIVEAFQKSDIKTLQNLEEGASLDIAPQIEVRRESDVDWVMTAPYGDEEWYFSEETLRMLAALDFSEFDNIENGREKLIFHDFSVKRRRDVLVSSIPVLRGKTLQDLCRISWKEIEGIKPGSRMDFGDNVRIPLTAENKHIVTYFGPKGYPFKYYSYYDIMKGMVQGGLVGKVFVVGSTVPSMFDIVSVPIDNEYPGVEVHASLMHSFLTDTFVTCLSQWQDFLILLLVGVIIGVIAFMLKPLAGSILTMCAVFVYFLVAMQVFGTGNLWIPIARPILTIILTYTAVMAYRYITEEKDRKFLQSTFKAYLSPELIDIMYKNKKMPKLGGEEGIRTAYFTDIQSFSTFSEKLGSPTRLVELLNEYLTAMTDILLEHYGTLDKYEGDAIIAFFGAPMPMDDHARQACITALKMQERLGDLRNKWISEGDRWPKIVHQMRMRIGINTGAITTGNMGSAVRMNYTMMGDAVNLAARLESAAKQYGVYTMISQATYDLVKDSFEVRLLDKITVVGRSEPVIVYEMMGEKGGIGPEQRKMVDIYNKGLGCFYSQDWDGAIQLMRESESLEPFREFAPKNMSPSRKIIEYCEMYKSNPPGPDWEGVMSLTSK